MALDRRGRLRRVPGGAAIVVAGLAGGRGVARAAGLAARVQGLRRYYALLLGSDGKARLVKALDGETVLAEADFTIEQERSYDLRLEVHGARLRAWVDGRALWDVADTDRPLAGGAVGLICEEGRISTDTVTVRPAAG